MKELRKCIYCGYSYFSNESAMHTKYHRKKIIAEEKFGHIATYNERELIKNYAYGQKDNIWCDCVDELIIYTYWCRSIEKSGFDINHPTFEEYYNNFDKPNIKWLEKGKSQVNMKLYKSISNGR